METIFTMCMVVLFQAPTIHRLPLNKDKVLTVKEQIVKIAKEDNFQYIDYLLRLARCENDTFDPIRTNTKGNYPSCSKDRGIFMINDYWHSEVSDECAYNVECATKWTMWRINNGFQHEWSCDKIVKGN